MEKENYARKWLGVKEPTQNYSKVDIAIDSFIVNIFSFFIAETNCRGTTLNDVLKKAQEHNQEDLCIWFQRFGFNFINNTIHSLFEEDENLRTSVRLLDIELQRTRSTGNKELRMKAIKDLSQELNELLKTAKVRLSLKK